MRLLFAVLTVLWCADTAALSAAELRMGIRAEPRTLDPHLATDENAEAVRYLTHATLLRVNRQTQQLEPELAAGWEWQEKGRKLVFRLRENLVFSDGTPFTPVDVVHSLQRVLDAKLGSPLTDSLRPAGTTVQVAATSKNQVAITLSSPHGGFERSFDSVAIVSAKASRPEATGLGPFVVESRQPGVSLILRRNPRYWKKDRSGKQLPYFDSVRLLILQNREIELQRFRNGEIDLIESLEPESYGLLSAQGLARDAGTTLDPDFLWVNLNPDAPLASHKKAWFQAKEFRQALSEAVNRDDLVRLAYKGLAKPGASFLSPANKLWGDPSLRAAYNPQKASQRLQKLGFQRNGSRLLDKSGTPVAFSLVTNSENKLRLRLATLIQSDLAKIGIAVTVVSLDMRSLITRITRTYDYDAALFGLANIDVDPSSQTNILLSSSPQHLWHPAQKKPSTPWEEEIDRLMQQQATTADLAARKTAIQRVQAILQEQAAVLYLTYKNGLVGVASRVRNASPAVLWPHTFWNVEWLAAQEGR